MQIRIGSLLLAVLLFSCRGEPPVSQTTTTATAAAETDDALLAAAREYVARESVVSQFHLTVEQKAGDFARLRVDPIAGETDPARVFMARRNGTWTGLVLGTGFPPDDLRALGIPEALWDQPEVAAHDVTGAYFPIDPLPAELTELEHLSLATIDENGAPAPLNGFLRPKQRSADDYTLVRPALDGKRLTFTTTAVNGVHYAFSGAFEVLDNFPQNPPSFETAVLTGTLTKLRDGREIAATPVKFRYEAGG